MIEFGPEICRDLDGAIQREWLETNGLGGYASSTIIGLNARRYHGLLIAALSPPVRRVALLSKLEETLTIDGRRFDLSTNEYKDAIHPQGFRHQVRFRLAPFPIFTYEIADLKLEKTVFMVHGTNTVVVQYEVEGARGRTVELEVRPFATFRDHHHLARKTDLSNPASLVRANGIRFRMIDGAPELHFGHTADALDMMSYWYDDFLYRVERERGFDCLEDLFSPFAMRFSLIPGRRASLIVSLTPHEGFYADELREKELARRRALIAQAPQNDLIRQLFAAADQFIVARDGKKTILAGYHWFSDWGRDAMISLPGLTLSTRRFAIARDILLEFSRHLDRGLLPNRFPDEGEAPEYNTADATLWFFEAVRAYLARSQDEDLIREELYEKLVEIIRWHTRGTRFGIRMDEDGLLAAGEAGVQLTWMDAKIGDWVVTPRCGKPVEIQALWYNALRTMQDFAQMVADSANNRWFKRLADDVRHQFNELFWNEELECLYDVVDRDVRDASVRPNQIFAVSLHHSLLDTERARKVLAIVERELLTPRGLRSLSPRDQRYQGRYAGGPVERDAAYHQGTVWAWLIGPFIAACLKIYGPSAEKARAARQLLNGFREHLFEAGVGQVSEIFDGDAPHMPRGCIAQAWSVAELLRIADEHPELLSDQSAQP